jgi:hypothetical protein
MKSRRSAGADDGMLDPEPRGKVFLEIFYPGALGEKVRPHHPVDRGDVVIAYALPGIWNETHRQTQNQKNRIIPS